MIKRVSVWRLKNKEDAETMKDALLSMKDKVPSLVDIEVGINISSHSSAFDIVFIGSFVNSEALKAFESDKFHESIGGLVNRLKEQRVVVDYEF
tara:strand:+ start:568 stop:849 length:282 start_codon:yes stop_codon:yes gene_type:complete